MPVRIHQIKKGSLAEKKKLLSGDLIEKVNGNPINDILDYDFYCAEEKLKIEVLRPPSERFVIRLKKSEYEDIGAEFESYLIDHQRSCRNNCIFCFVDQTPPGMRESLYFKDDDDRLSFLFGNYVTLTNITEEEIQRIIKMRISPINVSVHTTNPELRIAMMKNRFAGKVLSYLDLLAEGGIQLNCQLVLCPGINDGEELKRSLSDLSRLFPAVQSIACVPVGITRYREGLPELHAYTQETARKVIAEIHAFAESFQKEKGCRLAYPSDEFFLRAQLPLPEEEYYEDFSQLDNGVGMLTLLKSEFHAALYELPESEKSRKVSLATGTDAAPFLQNLIDELKKKWHNLECNVYAIQNDFFGHSITVAGLITGKDLLAQLSEKDLGEELLLPTCMLRHEQDKFLDDITLAEVKECLGLPIRLVENDGERLLNAICNL